jgi:hypothetical protein
MPGRERLPDEAWVVRCGSPPFEKSPLFKACGPHPDGPFGFSVQAAAGMTVDLLAAACRNNSVGYTTVRAIRAMGYDVLPTGGDFHHATVVVPDDWTEEAAGELPRLFQPARNPAPRRRP